MSLFPAYSEANEPSTSVQSEKTEPQDWLANSSFIPFPSDTKSNLEHSPSKSTDSDDKEEKQNNDVEESGQNDEPKKLRKRKHKKEHRKKSKHKKSKTLVPEPMIEFTGSEEYYVDKVPVKGYLSVTTLHKPACPRYQIQWFTKILGYHRQRSNIRTSKRYYLKNKRSRIEYRDWDDVERLTEQEFDERNRQYNRTVNNDSANIQQWLDFVHHQDHTHMKSLTRTQLAERKITILDKALKLNPTNDQLYNLYVDVIDQTYPSIDVSKILDGLLAKDPTSYTLWNAQIMATQGSMARCIVPDVLKLYEKCMQNMYRKANRNDQVMIKLFTSCSYFLRQSGLFEQFFALLKLALELNVSPDKFNRIQPTEQEQDSLIEYEEVVLKSGLPMTEIWLRIEKLRQNFYFLPCPESLTTNDPQRIVYNEDICHYVFPLARGKDNSFQLTIQILRLLKVPMERYCLPLGFQRKHEHPFEFDAIEDCLTILLTPSDGFNEIICELVKEFSVGPTYIPIHIGYENYLKCVTEILFLLSECFNEIEQKRIFITLWLRLERILLIFDKSTKRSVTDRGKPLRTRIKNLLKKDENRNAIIFYVEYALIEYELDRFDSMENIFRMAIELSEPTMDEDCSRAEYFHLIVTYVEILLYSKKFDQATEILISLALNEVPMFDGSADIGDNRKLLAIKRLTDRLNNLCFIERNVEIMELEQLYVPDYFINVIKAKSYLLLLLKNKHEALDQSDRLHRMFVEQTNRHLFIREKLYELQSEILRIPIGGQTSKDIRKLFNDAITLFPENLKLLRTVATLNGYAWHTIRTLMSKSLSPYSIVFLVASAQYRYKKSLVSDGYQRDSSNIDTNQYTYKWRVVNLLKNSTSKKSPLRKCSLLWRLYMKSLLDIGQDFEKSKRILFTALDDCPWNKALYLDGTVYVPQELAHIQDILIEKQLRIYALPEELEILRSDDATILMESIQPNNESKT